MTDLLTRMGGKAALEDFVDGLYDNMAADKNLGAFLKKDSAAIPFPHYLRLLKERTVDFCAANFGDETYHGPDLFAAHASLHISVNQYDITMKCARKKLKSMKMPKSVADEVYNEVEAMRDPIVDPQGTFHKWLIEKNKESEAALGADDDVVTNAMGFKVKASTLNAWAEKAAKDEERKKKMKELKAQREAEQAGGAPKAAPAKDKPAKGKAPKQAAAAKMGRLTSTDSSALALDGDAQAGRFVSADSVPSAAASPKLKPPASPASASTAGSGPAGASWSSAFTHSSESAASSFCAPDEYRPSDIPRSRPTFGRLLS